MPFGFVLGQLERREAVEVDERRVRLIRNVEAAQERRRGRIERLLRQSQLPQEKSWPVLDLKRLPPKVLQQARLLLEGTFVDRHEKVWAPYYTLHKIMAGLLDVHLYCGNRLALEVLENIATWLDGRSSCK